MLDICNRRLLDRFQDLEERYSPQEVAREPEDQTILPYREWLSQYFPHIASKPLSPRHIRLWDWVSALKPYEAPPALVEIWCRGGAKSTTAEMACCYAGEKRSKSFALYVSGTQEQADKHVQSIASLFEQRGIERAIGRYGNSKGWRRDQLRTANGFNVAGIGLDTAARGIKFDEYRPDFIIVDDIDDREDTVATVEKKERALTHGIMPAASAEGAAMLFVQNLIHSESIFNRIYQNRVDWLMDRQVHLEVAVKGLEVRREDLENGGRRWKIIAGTATWEGQNLAICEEQINRWGLRAFLQEAQHEVELVGGLFFDETKFGYCEASELPAEWKALWRCWDTAATKGGGDYTVGVLIGQAKNDKLYVLDVIRGQWESAYVRWLQNRTAERDANGIVFHADEFDERGTVLALGEEYFRFTGRVQTGIPQDPGAAGKSQVEIVRDETLGGYPVSIIPISGSKAKRAETWAEFVNNGDVILVKAPWNHAYKEEHRKFREDETHLHDDQVDASADCANKIGRPKLEFPGMDAW